MHQKFLFRHEFDSLKVTLALTWWWHRLGNNGETSLINSVISNNPFIFYQNNDFVLLGKSEADFPILIPRWICTREYPGRATPQYKLSFGTIWQVRFVFEWTFQFFFHGRFLPESICYCPVPATLNCKLNSQRFGKSALGGFENRSRTLRVSFQGAFVPSMYVNRLFFVQN